MTVTDESIEEVWRQYPEAPAYLVSNLGRVWSQVSEQYVGETVATTGYHVVNGRHQGRRMSRQVHRMVALTFLGEPPSDDHMVCHWNGIKTDNRVENLRWGTARENILDAVRQGVHNHAKKTHCIRGHPLSGDNLYVPPMRNIRACRTCVRIRQGRLVA